ncbi:ribosome biogenesis GTPase Der [Candidatus Gracilibacteria bacterium]|nr:ribosome biogenesis GTPase Der [Candidatus Gracilibacteria bacterium]MCF7819420.1 ribosome biogenesis GTPase Der [Candidatus Gracilibacteria bacterium]
METPVIAIIGRPNVGKSTLFNCFLKTRRAIVSDIPGTTRDNLMEKVQSEYFEYWLVDTAGLTNQKGDSLEQAIQMQAEVALQNADIILFLVDGKAEMTADDEEIVQKLRRSQKPVLLVANKIDDGQTQRILELTRFGFGEPVPVSAKNYTGLWELEEALDEKLKEAGFDTQETSVPAEEDTPEDSEVKLAFVGRPNVGKSSLLNAFVQSERSVVSEIRGTTRDTIDTPYTTEDGKSFLFLDTAGLRRPGKIGRDLDFWSTVRTQQAIERADVCALLIDALDGVTHQDLAIAGKIVEAGKGIVICVNKFDLVREKSRTEEESDDRDLDEVKMWGESLDQVRQKYMRYLSREIQFLPWAPVVFFSAKTGRGIGDLLTSAQAIAEERKKRISTGQLNRFLPEIVHQHVMPSVGQLQGNIKYVTQAEICPPTFIFFVNKENAFHFSYRRYLENKLREKYGFHGTPIKIEIRDQQDENRRPSRRQRMGKRK